jgi:hypothetical protein
MNPLAHEWVPPDFLAEEYEYDSTGDYDLNNNYDDGVSGREMAGFNAGGMFGGVGILGEDEGRELDLELYRRGFGSDLQPQHENYYPGRVDVSENGLNGNLHIQLETRHNFPVTTSSRPSYSQSAQLTQPVKSQHNLHYTNPPNLTMNSFPTHDATSGQFSASSLSPTHTRNKDSTVVSLATLLKKEGKRYHQFMWKC